MLKLHFHSQAKPLAEELHPSLSPSSSPAPTVGLKDVPASSQFTPWAQALMQETAEGEPERIFPEAVTAMERPRGGGSSGARAGHVAGLSTGRSLMPPSALPAGAKPQRGREGGFGSPTAAAATGAAAGGRSGAGGRLSVMSGTEVCLAVPFKSFYAPLRPRSVVDGCLSANCWSKMVVPFMSWMSAT